MSECSVQVRFLIRILKTGVCNYHTKHFSCGIVFIIYRGIHHSASLSKMLKMVKLAVAHHEMIKK